MGGDVGKIARGPADLAVHATNSVLGTNIGGEGGLSNDWMTQQANKLTGFNVFNAGNGTKAFDPNAPVGPSFLTGLNGQPTGLGAPGALNVYGSTSFAPRPLTGGRFNQMAQKAAGQVYLPQLMSGAPAPGLQPPAGLAAAMSAAPAPSAPGREAFIGDSGIGFVGSPMIQQLLARYMGGNIPRGAVRAF